MKLRRVLAAAAGFAILVIAGGVAYFTGLWIPNHPSTAEYPVRGIDVSNHQGAIDWSQVAQAPVHFAYIKATEGQDFRDARFVENWQGSAGAGLKRGAYHFFTLKSTGLQQAANFIAVVPKDPEALPPVVDVELWGNPATRPSVEALQHELSDFMNAVRTHYGQEPVIYTGNDYRDHFLRGFPQRRLWIRSVITAPRLTDHAPWHFWQYSEKKRVPGIAGFVDQNVFHGDRAAFVAFIHE
jgi:lysozyme